MSTRRVVLGALPGGGFGLRVSLPSFDVITDDPTDVHKFSFNSDWTDFLRTWQYGIISFSVGLPTSTVLFPDLGYIPYMELRQCTSSEAYDDNPVNYAGNSYATMARANVSTNQFNVSNAVAPGSIFYLVFAEPSA